MFLLYPKSKDNPDGDPVAKQGDRSTLLPRKNARIITQNGMKFYRKEDLYISHYQPKLISDTEKSLMTQAKLYMRSTPIFTKSVIIEYVNYYFSPLKSFTKAQKLQISNGQSIPKTTKPDLADNLNKLLMDSLNEVVFKDDALIWNVKESSKQYSAFPGVAIKLRGS